MNGCVKATLGLAAALHFCGAAHATPPTANYSDQWWNPSESGWGVSVSQQNDLMFMTLLVYAANNQPTWYTAVLVYSAEVSGAARADVFAGDLYVTTGPWFGSAFDPAGVIARKVGTATFNASSPTAASLSYTVDGTAVAKDLGRLTLRTVNNSGHYLGAISLIASCGAGAIVSRQNTAAIGVVQSATSVQIQTSDVGMPRKCTYTGPYIQKGQVADVDGLVQLRYRRDRVVSHLGTPIVDQRLHGELRSGLEIGGRPARGGVRGHGHHRRRMVRQLTALLSRRRPPRGLAWPRRSCATCYGLCDGTARIAPAPSAPYPARTTTLCRH